MATNANGVRLSTPSQLTGREIKRHMEIPDNNILTRMEDDGTETVIGNDEVVNVNENVRFNDLPNFERAADKRTGNQIKKDLGIPSTEILTKVKPDGSEEIIRDTEKTEVLPRDNFSSVPEYSRS